VSAEGRSEIYNRPENKNIWLFNITNDPYERIDLSETRPEVVETLLTMLADYYMTSVPCKAPCMRKSYLNHILYFTAVILHERLGLTQR
jgi:hypothetical protein